MAYVEGGYLRSRPNYQAPEEGYVMAPPKIRETYLGDGLYASFDGYQIRLRAPRGEGDHEVFLEHQTFLELLKYANVSFHNIKEKKDGDEK